jgi:hypothetical protein
MNLLSVPEGRSRGASGLPARQLKRGERGSVPASRSAMPRSLNVGQSGRDKKISPHDNLLRLVTGLRTTVTRERSPKSRIFFDVLNFNGSRS